MSTAATNTNAHAPTTPTPEQAVALAALILADDNLTITPEKLQILLKAAGIETIEPIWTTLFANVLKDKDIREILTTVATSDPRAGGDTAPHTHCDGGRGDGGAGDDEIDICAEVDSDEENMFGLFD